MRKQRCTLAVILAGMLTLASVLATATSTGMLIQPFPTFPMNPYEVAWEPLVGSRQATTGWVSNKTLISSIHESVSDSWSSRHPISGLRCANKNCAAIKSLAVVVGMNESTGILDTDLEDTWSPWISDGQGEICAQDMLVSGLQCQGSQCSELSIACSELRHSDYRIPEPIDEYITESFGDTHGMRSCQDGYYVCGILCSSKRCGTIKIICRKVEMRAPILLVMASSIGSSEENDSKSLCLEAPALPDSSENIHIELCSGNNRNQYWIQDIGGQIRLFETDFCLSGLDGDSYLNNNSTNSKALGLFECGFTNQTVDVLRGNTILEGSETAALRVKYETYDQTQWYCLTRNLGGFDDINVDLQNCSFSDNTVKWKAVSPVAFRRSTRDWQALATKFAPQLRFDQDCEQFPELSQAYWNRSTTDDEGRRVLAKPLEKKTPYVPSNFAAHYTPFECAGGVRIVITYWIFYAYQPSCALGFGVHEGDWENVVVELSSNFQEIHGVQISQHGGWYTRYPGSFEVMNDTHVVLYVGRRSKGMYHDTGGHFLQCTYWDDFRQENDEDLKRFSAWREGSLVPTTTIDPWNIFEGSWGRDGITGPAVKNLHHGTVCQRPHCHKDACAKSQHMSGDNKEFGPLNPYVAAGIAVVSLLLVFFCACAGRLAFKCAKRYIHGHDSKPDILPTGRESAASS